MTSKLLRWIAAIVLGFEAVIGCGESIVEPPAAPERPGDLRATLLSPRSVKLQWSAVPAVEALTYSVYRNDTKIGESNTTEFVDSVMVGNTAYTWFVSARTSAGGISAPSDPVTMTFGDIVAPTVVSTTPASAASGISRLPAPTITFSEPMIPLSVASVGGVTARITSTDEPVYGTVNYNASTRTVDFWPVSILPARTQITVSVSTKVKDVAGNGLAAPFSFTFTTGDSPGSVDELPRSEHPILLSRGFVYKPAPNITSVSREIVKVRADGSGEVRLTNDLNSDVWPSWSPDGRHIAFVSDRDGTQDIFIMRDDGTAITQLTSGDESQLDPQWSPDGRHIVFTSTKEGVPPPGFNTPRDIWIMNADGSGQANLTRSPSTYDAAPSISPDGKQLVFLSAGQLVLSNIDGSNIRPLKPADPAFIDDRAAWSPDGKRIAYSAFNVNHPAFNENYLLFLINADGTNRVQLTSGGSQRLPAWSPDGNSLVFSISGQDEFWGRFGKIGAATMNLSTRVFTVIAPQDPPSEVMSPQAWRR